MIYLDNNATTRIDEEVLGEVLACSTEFYGNPSSINNRFGRMANDIVEDSLYTIKDCFHAQSINDLVITSGATEANNLAITGILESGKHEKKHLIVSCIEHPSILSVCRYWEKKGVECTYIPVDKNGVLSLEVLEDSIRPETCLISVMSANNEIGTIQPIQEVARIASEKGILFHTDATQYLYYRFLNVKEIPVDMISFSSHKLHGPKGVGGLYINSMARSRIHPIILGGGQQGNLRSGTLNVPGIAGMAKAMSLLKRDQKAINDRLVCLRKILFQRISKKYDVYLNGSMKDRIPGNLNLFFLGIPAAELMERMPDIMFSMGSACGNHIKNGKSHVLQSIGLTSEQIEASFRLGLSKFTTEEEIISTAEQINEALEMIMQKNGKNNGRGKE